ncbi:MAG: DUF3299 domain-containing protein [Gammaproteobacteria bacterium TMED1]|nr:MAG: DUF3299 domain-containing protein [Gammaproteobacteria bacterium TMED1]|tara:strand:- start:1405 stop:1902 length:498 start_codon:yes stop_codon:yes gene_type:complete
MDDTIKLYQKHTMTLNIHFFSYFIAVIFLTMSHSSSAELEIISWQDLAPEYDGSMGLDDVPWGERVRPEMNEKIVRIPGFIVPLDFEQRQSVTRFLLVPYFGACIHEPPPPPNQTIYAEFEPGYNLESFWQPFWIEGKIFVNRVEEDLATALYTLSAEKIELYDY